LTQALQQLQEQCHRQPVNLLAQELQQPHRAYPDFNKYNMILNELYERSPAAYQDIGQDNSQPRLGDLRKTRLTLRQLNKLRQMNDVRSYEYKEKLKDIKKQYAPPATPPTL
jgi:hypothetical protein